MTSGITAWLGAASQHAGVPFTKVVAAGRQRRTGRDPRARARNAHARRAAPRDVDGRLLSVAWSFLVEIVGGVVRANHWLLDLSLFHHIAPAPAADPRWVADGLFVIIGFALAALGAAIFVRRDIATA